MAEFVEGEKVFVSAVVADESECDFASDVAGKEAFVAGYYPKDNEVFVVSELGRKDGTYVPLDRVSKLD